MINPSMNSQSRVKPITAYIKDAIKFYDLDNPFVAQILFLVQLGILFGGYWFARPYVQEFAILFEQFSVRFKEQLQQLGKVVDISIINTDLYANLVNASARVLLIILVIRILSFFISLFYGTYYHFSLTQPTMRGSQRFMVYLRRLPKLIIFNVLFYIAFFIGALVLTLVSGFITLIVPVFSLVNLLLPVFLFGLMALFIFKDLLIIEFDVGIFNNFKRSWDITRDCKRNVIVNGMFPLCVSLIISLFAMDVGNLLLALFISSFFEVIIIMITRRLTVLMFADAASLERHDLNKKPLKTQE
jgi:hypothetical protein